jgi:hypothetical protein
MGLALVLFMFTLIALNIILVKQNRDLKASMNARPSRPEDIKPGTTVPALEGRNLSGDAFTISYGVDPLTAITHSRLAASV